MAVINCPNCKKKISSKATTCTHCDVDLSSVDEEKLENYKTVNRIKQTQNNMMVAFVAMLMFCGGFLFFYMYDAQIGTWEYVTSVTCSIVGFVLYIVTRLRLILIKRKYK